MKKSELEKAQKQFNGNTKADAAALRRRVSSDLNIVKDAYDVGSVALTEAAKLLSNVQFSDNPTKELKLLASAYKDIATTLVMLRQEGRTTIAEAVASQAPQPADPPSPVEQGVGAVHTTPDKFSSSHKSLPPHSPTPLGEFLKGVSNGSSYEVEGAGQGLSGSVWVPGPADEESDEGDGEP